MMSHACHRIVATLACDFFVRVHTRFINYHWIICELRCQWLKLFQAVMKNSRDCCLQLRRRKPSKWENSHMKVNAFWSCYYRKTTEQNKVLVGTISPNLLQHQEKRRHRDMKKRRCVSGKGAENTCSANEKCTGGHCVPLSLAELM